MICRKAAFTISVSEVMLPDANSLSSRAQNRCFCALLSVSFFPMASPASNKPHPAEKSTPVWLAIWRISAGFANSQHRDAAFHSTYHHICAHPHCCYLGSAAQTDANLSAHLHRLPTPPPYLCRMRLLPGLVRRSCKSPRARILVLGTSGAHWPARWPRFELTERIAKS